MFNYTKETIINDLSKLFGENGENFLGIKRGGNYDLANVEGLKIYKTKGVAGVKGKVSVKVKTAFTPDNQYRFTMFIASPNKNLGDYGFADWAQFGKPVMVEFTGTGDVNRDASALADVLKLSLQPDNKAFSVSVAADTVTIECTESWMKLEDVKIVAVSNGWDASGNLTIVYTPNVEEFATGKWLVENLRFPSYPNVRYNALYSDESPVAGRLYNQYAFEYRVKRSASGGMSGVGQVVDSITTHVIYVPAELCAENLTTPNTFEKVLQDVTAGISTIIAGGHANEFVISLVLE